MGYIGILIIALMWSFVGVMVKAASVMVSTGVISFCRFLFGSLFLAIFILIKDRKITISLRNKWIWLGAFGESVNYLFENIGIVLGFAYGYIVSWPVHAIVLLFISVVFLKEEFNPRKLLAVLLCMLGIFLTSWHGTSLSGFFKSGLLPIVFFFIAAVGAGFHITSKKKLIGYLDSGNMNLSVFLLGSVITAAPLPFNFHFSGNVNILAVFSVLGLGLVTGASYLIYTEALKKISFLVAALFINIGIPFSLLWAWVFYRENINMYVIIGTLFLISGLVVLGLPVKNHMEDTNEDKNIL